MNNVLSIADHPNYRPASHPEPHELLERNLNNKRGRRNLRDWVRAEYAAMNMEPLDRTAADYEKQRQLRVKDVITQLRDHYPNPQVPTTEWVIAVTNAVSGT